MRYDYIITLKQPSYRYIDIISQLLLLLFLLQVADFAMKTGLKFKDWRLLVCPVFVIAWWAYSRIRAKKGDFVPHYRVPLLIAGIGWYSVGGPWWWMALIYGGLGFSERFIKFPDEIGFTKEGVVRNTFPKRQYEWVEIDNVMIRDNLFTLDLRNNKIIQRELDEPIDKELENEFNAFCKEQLLFDQVK